MASSEDDGAAADSQTAFLDAIAGVSDSCARTTVVLLDHFEQLARYAPLSLIAALHDLPAAAGDCLLFAIATSDELESYARSRDEVDADRRQILVALQQMLEPANWLSPLSLSDSERLLSLHRLVFPPNLLRRLFTASGGWPSLLVHGAAALNALSGKELAYDDANLAEALLESARGAALQTACDLIWQDLPSEQRLALAYPTDSSDLERRRALQSLLAKGLLRLDRDSADAPQVASSVLAHYARQLAPHRHPTKSVASVPVSQFRLDTAQHLAYVDGAKKSLSPNEFALLQYLVERAERVCTRAELRHHFYPHQFEADADANIRRLIKTLRDKLGLRLPGEPPQYRLIHTRPGVGYIFTEESVAGT